MTPPVALAHDVLAARAGGERVLFALADLYPAAPIHTLIFEAEATFGQLRSDRVQPSVLNRLGWLRRHYRQAVPVAALTFAAQKVDAAVTICSTSGLSHHVRTSGAKIVYCHTPARWLHDSDNYLDGYRRPVRSIATAMAPAYRRLDRRAMWNTDIVVANSQYIADQIREVYGLTARVVAPCSTFDLEGPVEALSGVEPGFVLSPVRPLGYKRLDLLVAAAKRHPELSFVHIGDGPHAAAFRAQAPANVQSFGAVSDAQLRWAYRHSRVVALTCAEDFGLVPLEAAAHGVHTAAPSARGLLDHDLSMVLPYEFGSLDGLVEAINKAPDPTGIHDVSRLGRKRFGDAIAALVDELR